MKLLRQHLQTLLLVLLVNLAWTVSATGQDTAAPVLPRQADKATLPAVKKASSEKSEKPAFSSNVAALMHRAQRSYDSLKSEIGKLEGSLKAPGTDNARLNRVRDRLEGIRRAALSARSSLTGLLAEQKEKLTQLGPAPKKGETEALSTAQLRKRLELEVTGLEGMAKKLDVLALEANQLNARAAAIQRERFISQVFVSTTSILNPVLWYQAAGNIPEFLTRASGILKTWAGAPAAGGKLSGYVSMLLYAALCALALAGILLVWAKMARPPQRVGPPDNLRRIWRAVAGIIFVTIFVFLVYFLSLLLVNITAVGDLRVSRFVYVLGTAIAETVLVVTVLRAVMAPSNSAWRLVNMDDASARRFYRAGFVATVVYGINSVIAGTAEITFMPFDFTIGLHAMAGLLLLILLAVMLVTARSAKPLDEQDPFRHYYFSWAGKLFLIIWLIILLAFGAELFGYIAFAYFIVSKTLLSAAVIASLYLIHHLVDALVLSGTQAHSPFGRFLRHRMVLGEVTISRLGIALSTVTDLAILLFGIPVVLGLWAITWVSFNSIVDKFVFGFTIGDVTINLSGILLGVVVLLAGIIVARLFTLWVDRRILGRTSLDAGIRNSIVTGTKYTAFTLAVLFALSVAGLDFSKLAIVAGALSLGIGFGLQSVVSNFVSGLILLAERPIRIGDWIVVSGNEGTVKKINVRSTEIETFDRCSLIIPNSNLISQVVENWSHGSPIGRIKINIGVSYDSDPDQVREILLACANTHERVIPAPAPRVVFYDFGASSLDFQLRVFIDDIGYCTIVASDLRFEIFRALKDAGIEIPFPQRDIHLRDISRLEKLLVRSQQKPKPRTRKKPAARK